MTTCLVTGGAGFIGCALSGPLADRYGDVVAWTCFILMCTRARCVHGAWMPGFGWKSVT